MLIYRFWQAAGPNIPVSFRFSGVSPDTARFPFPTPPPPSPPSLADAANVSPSPLPRREGRGPG